MKVYVCDKCGKTHRILTGIVGSEFDLHGFTTLQKHYQTTDVVDVCAKCLKTAESVLDAERKAQREREIKAVRSLLQ